MSTLSTATETAVIGHDGEAYRTLARLLDRAPLRLVDAEGNAVPVPAELHDGLRALIGLLAADKAAQITGINHDLTTQQAANLLGVSRPTFIRLLEDGALPYRRVRSHRRIRLADLLTYRDVQRAERRRNLDELVRIGEELGGYDATPEELAAFRASVRASDAEFDEDAVAR